MLNCKLKRQLWRVRSLTEAKTRFRLENNDANMSCRQQTKLRAEHLETRTWSTLESWSWERRFQGCIVTPFQNSYSKLDTQPYFATKICHCNSNAWTLGALCSSPPSRRISLVWNFTFSFWFGTHLLLIPFLASSLVVSSGPFLILTSDSNAFPSLSCNTWRRNSRRAKAFFLNLS